MSALAARGLVGYDLESNAYFHRVLPFDMDKIQALQPRLKAAYALIEENGVRLHKQSDKQIEFLVNGTDVKHRVRLSEDADKCSCQWFSKYQGERGVCKHILAARIFHEDNEA